MIGHMDSEDLVPLLIRLRDRAGFTQAELAQRMGVGQSAVGNIESRGRITVPALFRWLRACNHDLVIRSREEGRAEVVVDIESTLAGLDESDLGLVLGAARALSDDDELRRMVAVKILRSIAGDS